MILIVQQNRFSGLYLAKILDLSARSSFPFKLSMHKFFLLVYFSVINLYLFFNSPIKKDID